MDLPHKIRSLPASPGVYLYKNAEGEVIYVGKAKNLRSRVSSYFHEGRWEDAKTGTLVREPARWSARRSTSITSLSPITKRHWLSRTTSSSRRSRASTSCCVTTRLTPT